MAINKAHFYPFEADSCRRAQRLIFVTNRGPVEHSFGLTALSARSAEQGVSSVGSSGPLKTAQFPGFRWR